MDESRVIKKCLVAMRGRFDEDGDEMEEATLLDNALQGVMANDGEYSVEN